MWGCNFSPRTACWPLSWTMSCRVVRTLEQLGGRGVGEARSLAPKDYAESSPIKMPILLLPLQAERSRLRNPWSDCFFQLAVAGPQGRYLAQGPCLAPQAQGSQTQLRFHMVMGILLRGTQDPARSQHAGGISESVHEAQETDVKSSKSGSLEGSVHPSVAPRTSE